MTGDTVADLSDAGSDALDITALRVEPDGSVHLSDREGPVRFRFSFRDVPFRVLISQQDAETRLALVGDAGPYPYTAESRTARENLSAILDSANDAFRHKGVPAHFRITDQGAMVYVAETPVATPLGAADMVTTLAELVLHAAPYLECISAFVRPPDARRRPDEVGAVRSAWRTRHGHR